MADHQPGLVEDARIAMGVSLTDMREVNRRWQAMVRSPRARGAVERYRSVLGPPEAVVRRKAGDLECEATQWRVPLWPDLRLEVITGPGGVAWNEWLVRAPGAAGPVLTSAADLVPWSATVDEVAGAFGKFGPVRMLDGAAPTRARLAVTLPGGEARVAEFTWGLFQELREAPR
ncbi:hypothetical protein OG897_07965 [Streptomyces sp. NBC_00237]|uniref:hypothetical protein n=1 Tax=Streptomyces sp. NBC_00237 TaxID=2975687 RepID=UPI00224E8EF6|nr:hypothetical protein [Streptomyces sp. NBC_00237]MCX5201386.1 hypothetical protein [Streptomyces sp. NBC_00237]